MKWPLVIYTCVNCHKIFVSVNHIFVVAKPFTIGLSQPEAVFTTVFSAVRTSRPDKLECLSLVSLSRNPIEMFK